MHVEPGLPEVQRLTNVGPDGTLLVRLILEGTTWDIRAGQHWVVLGPNGAGKSTLLKALLGFIKPAEGRMTVLGLDVAERPLEIRARIGYMPETDGHIPGMNAVSFVAYCGQLAGLPAVDAMQRAHEVLYYVGLGEARYRNLETYSTGMKQRIKLAQALVHDPDLLFLDEPTNGMDPKGRDEMLALVRDLAHNKGVNLILSSHLLPDVEYTCDHVVVMDKGAIAAAGPIAAMKQPRGRVYELRVKTPSGDIDPFLAKLRAAGLDCHATDEDVMRVFVPAGVSASGVIDRRLDGSRFRARTGYSPPSWDDMIAGMRQYFGAIREFIYDISTDRL